MNQNQLSVTDMQNISANIQQMITVDVSQSLRQIGALQYANLVKKVVTCNELEILINLKNSKTYQKVPLFDNQGKSYFATNWEQFCNVLGYSVEKVDLDIRNYIRLGVEGFESCQKLGLGTRAISSIARIPETEREAIIEVATQPDATIEKVMGLFEDYMLKKSAEKEALTQQNTELTAKLEDVTGDLESVRKISAEKTKHLDEAREQLERTRRQIADADPEAVGEELRLNLSAVQVSIESEMTKLRPLLEQLIEHGQVNGVDHTPTIVGCLNQIIRNSEYLRESYHLPQEAPTDEIPAWVKAMQDEGKVN